MMSRFGMGREHILSYTVHEQPDPASDRVDRAEALAFVRDGFSPLAFVIPELWLIVHHIWLGLAAYLVGAAAILALAWLFGLPPLAVALLFLLVHLVFSCEADEILRAHLTSKGWTMVGQVVGTTPLDCERRFLDQWLQSTPMMTGATLSPISKPATPEPARVAGILGNLIAPIRRRTPPNKAP